MNSFYKEVILNQDQNGYSKSICPFLDPVIDISKFISHLKNV